MSDTAAPPWVEPTQARSREKVTRVLDAAIDLAVEHGSLDLKMTEVAARADVAIGTLYQFFPTRTALIAKLFAREMEPIDARVSAALTGFTSLADLSARIEAELRANLDLVRTRPGLKLIWSSASIDPVIEAADFRNTRQNATVLKAQMMAHLPAGANPADVAATALLICHLWGSLVRLCSLADDDEVDTLIEQYAGMLAAQAERLAGRSA